MTTLQQRQEKIQAKRKQTPWRDFVREICSWYSLSLYKNNGLISICDENPRVSIVDHKDYMPEVITEDLTGSAIFEGLDSLLHRVGVPNLIHFSENVNAQYANCVLNSKNIYLSFTVIREVENAMYSFSVKTGSQDIIDGFMIWDNSQNVYKSKCVITGYNVFYSKYINNSSDIRFSSNMVGCRECLFCDGLINQSYCIRNTQYTKEEYHLEREKILSNKAVFDRRYSQVSNQGENTNSSNVHGNYLVNCINIEQGNMLYEIEGSRNAILIGGKDKGTDVYDCFLNTPPIDSIYGGLSLGTGCEHVYCSMHLTRSSQIFYSLFLEDCSFCLGCIGLKNKSYCILNKQYTKEERYEKVDAIFTQMERDGQLGEFFPASMNPFYFNDTAAYLIDPSFTKEEVTNLGYLRRDEPIKVDIPEGAVTVKSSELGQFESWEQTHPILPGQGGETNRQWKLDETVCKRVIIDENGDAYRIIPMELEFLQKHGLPLPRKHWLTRMKENFRIN